jgi:hypothetical protein
MRFYFSAILVEFHRLKLSVFLPSYFFISSSDSQTLYFGNTSLFKISKNKAFLMFKVFDYSIHSTIFLLHEIFTSEYFAHLLDFLSQTLPPFLPYINLFHPFSYILNCIVSHTLIHIVGLILTITKQLEVQFSQIITHTMFEDLWIQAKWLFVGAKPKNTVGFWYLWCIKILSFIVVSLRYIIRQASHKKVFIL